MSHSTLRSTNQRAALDPMPAEINAQRDRFVQALLPKVIKYATENWSYDKRVNFKDENPEITALCVVFIQDLYAEVKRILEDQSLEETIVSLTLEDLQKLPFPQKPTTNSNTLSISVPDLNDQDIASSAMAIAKPIALAIAKYSILTDAALRINRDYWLIRKDFFSQLLSSIRNTETPNLTHQDDSNGSHTLVNIPLSRFAPDDFTGFVLDALRQDPRFDAAFRLLFTIGRLANNNEACNIFQGGRPEDSAAIGVFSRDFAFQTNTGPKNTHQPNSLFPNALERFNAFDPKAPQDPVLITREDYQRALADALTANASLVAARSEAERALVLERELHATNLAQLRASHQIEGQGLNGQIEDARSDIRILERQLAEQADLILGARLGLATAMPPINALLDQAALQLATINNNQGWLNGQQRRAAAAQLENVLDQLRAAVNGLRETQQAS